MQTSSFYTFLKEKKLFVYLFLYFTLIAGFIFDENSTGGAILDYENQKLAVAAFADKFIITLLNYDQFATRHSPVLIIFLSFLEKLNFDDNFIRLIHMHVCLLLPFLFYKILVKKFGDDFKEICIILSYLIFLSPTFRTLSIWPDSRILGLIFFSLSILDFLKFQKTKKFNYAINIVIFYSISSYISPNFSVFSIFYFIYFVSIYKFFSKKIFFIIIINLIIASPAFYYIFILDIDFLSNSAAVGGINPNKNILFTNIFNNILLTSSLIFFYLVPFVFTKIIEIQKILSYQKIIFALIVFITLVINFDYSFDYSGGGIIFRFSNFVFENNLIFFIFSYISILFLFTTFENKKMNYFLFFLIILNNPQYTIYHKYFDPFLIIIFFSLFSFKLNLNKILELKNLLFINIYFICFLIINNLRELWKI